MNGLSRSFLVAAALVMMANLAQGATAGHLLKSATPAVDTDQDITGSITKPDAAVHPHVSGSTTKHGAKNSDVTGSIKPKPDSSR